jgi:hypothetical protein
MAGNLNYGEHMNLSKSLFFPENFRQCHETGDNNRIPENPVLIILSFPFGLLCKYKLKINILQHYKIP